MKNRLSRRDFLKRSGILVVAAPVATHGLNYSQRLDTIAKRVGRAFDVTDLHDKAHLSSDVMGQLAPDSVVSIIGKRDNWYQVNGGWVQRTALQPILPYRYPAVSETMDFWAEMIAPVSSVKAWCAAHAPVISRLGFGAVVYVIDRMIDDSKQVWYGVAAEPGSPLIGWTPALHYAQWMQVDLKLTEPLIRIAVRQNQLMIYDKGKVITASYYGPSLSQGTTTLSRMQPSAQIDVSIPLGLPWLMRLGSGYPVYGAYWHNRFGEAGHGSAIELTTFAARWLYERLQSSVKVVIE